MSVPSTLRSTSISRWFPSRCPNQADPGETRAQPHADRSDALEPPPFDIDRLLETLLEALAGLDEEAIRRGARTAVDELAGMEPGRPVGGTYYLYRTLRRLDLADLEERLISALTDDQDLSDFDRRLLREEVEARIERLRRRSRRRFDDASSPIEAGMRWLARCGARSSRTST